MLLPVLGDVSAVTLLASLALIWLLCACGVAIVGRLVLALQPWPSFEGQVLAVSSIDEWNELLRQAMLSNSLVVVDCYARWCPPCKIAASVYAQMSLEYSPCVFAKVDVDKASSLARLLDVHAMPTFKLFAPPARGCPHMALREECVGWNEARLRSMLTRHGARRVELEEGNVDDHCSERSQLMCQDNCAGAAGRDSKAASIAAHV